MQKANLLSTVALGALLLIGAGCSQPASAPAPSATPESGAETIVPQEPGNSAAGTMPEGSGASGAADEGVDMLAKDDATKVFAIVAKNFTFSPSEIRVKVGDKVRLEVSSEDTGIDKGHGIAIPAFGVDVKVNKDAPGVAEFVADKAGEFPFFCNVFCGSGHKAMTGKLIVE
jgi:cytochrome c oxidase subunit 2